MRRLFLVPRWSGAVDGDFYKELSEHAARLKFALVQLVPPKGLNPPDLADAFAMLEHALADATEQDVIMGHSVGCQIILRYLARLESKPVPRLRLLCVAGWMFIDKSWPSIEPFLKDDADWALAKQRLRSITLFVSDNDQFTSDYRANIRHFQTVFGTSFVAPIVIPGGKHFNNSSEPALVARIGEALSRPQSLWEPLAFEDGTRLNHRITLAPLTNCQSHDDGTLSDEEFTWLSMRAKGGFSMTLTTATFVHGSGKAFPGQLGISTDGHIAGLKRLTSEIRAHNSVSIMQLHHGGAKSEHTIDGVPRVAATDKEGARTLTTAEVGDMVEWFVRGAERAKEAGFDGVEVHGAHGYILTSFLASNNTRDDQYGGSLENRTRCLLQIVSGIRQRCGPAFVLGVRLSVERFNLSTADMVATSQMLCDQGLIDFLDLSLWDVFKLPEHSDSTWMSLLGHFMQIDRKRVKIGVVGKVIGTQGAAACLELGCDFVFIGRSAVVHHNFPQLVKANPDFVREVPTTDEKLVREGISPKFLAYLHKNFHESLFAVHK